MFKIHLAAFAKGARRVRPYIERVEADNAKEAADIAKIRVEQEYPNNTVIVEEVWQKVELEAAVV